MLRVKQTNTDDMSLVYMKIFTNYCVRNVEYNFRTGTVEICPIQCTTSGIRPVHVALTVEGDMGGRECLNERVWNLKVT